MARKPDNGETVTLLRKDGGADMYIVVWFDDDTGILDHWAHPIPFTWDELEPLLEGGE